MHNICFQSLSSPVGHTSPRLSKAGCPVLFNTPQLAVVLPDTRKLVYPFQMAVCSCYCDYVQTFIKCANVIRVGTGEPERQTSCAFTICIVAIIETNWVMSPPGMKNTQACAKGEEEDKYEVMYSRQQAVCKFFEKKMKCGQASKIYTALNINLYITSWLVFFFTVTLNRWKQRMRENKFEMDGWKQTR